jgi:hypothetical protein
MFNANRQAESVVSGVPEEEIFARPVDVRMPRVRFKLYNRFCMLLSGSWRFWLHLYDEMSFFLRHQQFNINNMINHMLLTVLTEDVLC